ncbi:MAG: hypothetical protein V4857_05780 [Pseudomonadota bacterium]
MSTSQKNCAFIGITFAQMPFSVQNPSTTTIQAKKNRPEGRLFYRADYFAGTASAAAEAAVEAALEATAAASAATEAASEATAAALAASGVPATGAAAAGAVSTTGVGSGATTGASSFFVQAAKATANRETISNDFFMDFSLIVSDVKTMYCDE